MPGTLIYDSGPYFAMTARVAPIPGKPPTRQPRSAAKHSIEMVEHRGVLVLGAEQDHLGVLFGANRVSRRPIEQIARTRILLGSVLEADDEFTFNEIAPMGGLAEIVLQTLEEWR